MKIGQFFKNLASGSMILAALACPVFNSCADFGAELEDMKGDIADLENRVTALEEKLNTDLTALQALLEGKIEALDGRVDGIEGDLTDLIATVDGLVTVEKCQKNANGSVDITLTDGTKFTVQPETDYSGLVTTTEIDGVLYWAIFDENGKAVAVNDADGNLVPVIEAVPQVKRGDDGFFYVSFDGGETWEPTGVNNPCVFSDVEVVYTDNYTDEEEAAGWAEETPMYVVLTLADGNTITVTLDGVASFMFGAHMGNVSTQYIACGFTTSVDILTTNIQGWIKEVPAGWKVEEVDVENARYGGASFCITAPTKEAIASGAALAEGDIKVLAVAEGGKSVNTKLFVTTKPFTGVSVGKGALTVNMNDGLGGYLVGVSTVADYDPEAITAELKPVIEAVEDYGGGDLYPAWSEWVALENETTLDDNYFSYSIEEWSLSDLNITEELVEGGQYIIWVVPLNVKWVGSGWFATAFYSVGEIQYVEYFDSSIELETTALTFNDIQISAEFKGITSYYGGFSMIYSDGLNKEGILAEFNSSLTSSWGAPVPLLVNDEYVEGWDNGVYTGDPNTLVNGWQPIEPGASYYLYIIPAVEGKTEYSMAEVYWFEWTTEDLVAGGTVNVTVDEESVVADYKSISVPLEAEEATYIIYKFVEPAMVPTIEDKATYLVENGNRVVGSEAIATEYNLSPATTKTLLAIAVDKYGCYGDVYQKDFSTMAMEFASVTVSAELVGKADATTTVKVAASGDVASYYYWCDEKESYQWTNDYYFGGSAESASNYIALNPESWLLTNVAADALPADGLVLEGLSLGVKYVFVVAAQLADGSFTKATVLDIEPQLDLGEFVYATDDNGNENPVWAAAKPKVEYTVESVGDFNIVEWTVEVPEGFTGKTTAMHPENLSTYPTAKDQATFVLVGEYAYSVDLVEGETYSNYYVSKGSKIYVVIFDADGNCYEPYVYDIEGLGGWGV